MRLRIVQVAGCLQYKVNALAYEVTFDSKSGYAVSNNAHKDHQRSRWRPDCGGRMALMCGYRAGSIYAVAWGAGVRLSSAIAEIGNCAAGGTAAAGNGRVPICRIASGYAYQSILRA